MECVACRAKKENIKDDLALIPCDHCKEYYCGKCLAISPTEVRVLQLRNRVMKIFCSTCEEKLEVVMLKGGFEMQKLEITMKANIELVNELRDKNRVLNDNIRLLEENKALLEKSLEYNSTPSNPLQSSVKGDIKNTETGDNKSIPTYSKAVQNSNKKTIKSNSGRHQSINAQNLIAAQSATMNEIINLAHEEGRNTQQIIRPLTTSQSDDGFQVVVNKKKNPMRAKGPETKFATGKNLKSDRIAGAIRRKWIYVGRIVGKDVTESDIKEYLSDLKDCEKFDCISIKKLDTLGSNSAFCIGLPTDELYDKVFNTDYWNEGVSLRVYDLKRSFLSQRIQTKNALHPQ